MIHALKNFIIFVALLNLQGNLYADEAKDIPKLLPKEEANELAQEEVPQLSIVQNEINENQGFSRFLNMFEVSGYFRTRFHYLRNAHLGTYIERLGLQTSRIPPNIDLGEKEEQNNYSFNMRLKIDPTLNVSELVRVRSSISMLDNLVFGSNPSCVNNEFCKSHFLSSAQSLKDTISVNRLWGEVSTPIGDIKFGRQPFHWGLGVLYNSGDTPDSDYADQLDGFLFNTKFFDHYITPAYFVSFSGYNKKNTAQSYPLLPKDMAHILSLSFLKKDSDISISQKKSQNLIYNYGLFTSYHYQNIDHENYDFTDKTNAEIKNNLITRNAHISVSSFWQSFDYKTFHLESEFVGILGKYLDNSKEVIMMQGGAALESRYGFLKDQLRVGLDLGIASSSKDNQFIFNRAYKVDSLLYKEILGAIKSSGYIKPHISYLFSKNLGVRTDVLSSLALNPQDFSSKKRLLGIEIDASVFARSEDGLYFSANYGIVFPLGLGHSRGDLSNNEYKKHKNAKNAHVISAHLGINF